MITRTDAVHEIMYFLKHPLEIFCELQWGGMHWKQVVGVAR